MPDPNASPESAAPAPGADSAATQPDSTAAAEPSAAAAPPAPEVAAPTTPGAEDAPPLRTLDSIREKYRSRSKEGEPKAEASPTTDKADTEKPSEDKPGDEAEGAEGEEPDAKEVDPLAEFEEPRPPTREEIFKLRIPAPVKEQFAEVAEKLTAKLADEQAIGGAQGVEFAKSFNPVVWDANPTEEVVDKAFDVLTETNTPLVLGMGQRLIRTALDDEETGPAFGGTLLKEWYGEDATHELITKLVEAHKAGLIDVEGLDEDLAAVKAAKPAAEVEQLRAKVTDLENQLKQTPEERQRAAREKESERRDDEVVDRYVTDRAIAVVLPIAERVGWAAREGQEGATPGRVLFGNILTTWLNEQVKTFPEWHAIRDLKKNGTAYRDGKPTSALVQKTDSLESRSKGLFLKTVRELQAETALPTPRAAQKPTPPAKNDSEGGDNAPPPPNSSSKPKTLDEIRDKYRRMTADAAEEESVGRAVRR
jgi:hypothetical protein